MPSPQQGPVQQPQNAPPPLGEALESSQMQQFLYNLYERTGADGLLGEKVRISSPKNGEAAFTNENFYQALLTLNMGLYSNYTTDIGNIAYGFACNVRRSGGKALTVGGQINAWGDPTGAGRFEGVFGLNAVALGPRGHQGALIGIETSPVPFSDDSTAAKIGLDDVFIIASGTGAVAVPLGANRYNYFSKAVRIASIPRSPSGEFCGWATGIEFISDSLDLQNAPNWSAVVTYQAGQLVFDVATARYYKAIQPSLNQAPAPVSAFWVLYLDNKAIGIDFSTCSIQQMGRIGSAVRVRDTMRIDYNAEGTIGQLYDPVTGRMAWSNLALGAPPADRFFEVDVITGFIYRFNVFVI